jgi:hypothetical protein
VEKAVGSAVTRFYYWGDRVIEERDGSDAVTAFYTALSRSQLRHESVRQ